MCGIFGWIKFLAELTEQEKNFSRSATELLAHRGPDGGGEWSNKFFFAGHRRLKIIELSENAAQPFWSDDGRFLLLYNGELYNYKEIKKKLIKNGVKFSTNSDTEVFLAAFIYWKEDAFSYFDGMFAASIYDLYENAHYIIRDHLGQKPLYYFDYREGVIFASELRAILSIDSFSWFLNKDNFLRFLSLSFYPWDNTPVEGVKKLLPGHFLKIKEKKVRLIKYWDSKPSVDVLDIEEDEALSELEQLLTKSVSNCLQADVPVGVFFSGGVDSSLLLKLSIAEDKEIPSFSVAMSELDYNEGEKATFVSNHLEHDNCNQLTLTPDKLEATLQQFLLSQDEPHGDPGAVNALFLSKQCQGKIKVALAGDGADELFSGYAPFNALLYEPFMEKAPEYVCRAIKKVVEIFLPSSDGYLSLQFKLLAFLQGFPANKYFRFPLWLSSSSKENLSRLCPWKEKSFFKVESIESKETLFSDIAQILKDIPHASKQQQMLYFYQKFFLPEFVCMHTDRASMQAGLEVRSPFLSVPLVEFANKLPDNFKSDKQNNKIILRNMMKKIGFPYNIYQQKKHGFTFPVARWLKYELKPYVDALLEDSMLIEDNLISYDILKQIISEHYDGKKNHYRIIYNLICFYAWRNSYPHVIVKF